MSGSGSEEWLISSPGLDVDSNAHSNGHNGGPGNGYSDGSHFASQRRSAPRAPRILSTASYTPVTRTYLSEGSRLLPSISIRAFCLGVAFGACFVLSILLLYIDLVPVPTRRPLNNTNTRNNGSGDDGGSSKDRGSGSYQAGYLWRVPFFIGTLSVFHYLEFDMTARYNTADARVESFLLFNNGWAYTMAHCMAILECVLRWWWWSLRSRSRNPHWASTIPTHDQQSLDRTSPLTAVYTFGDVLMYVGILLVAIGQTTRSLAMKTAGRSFNHIVQNTRKTDHVLITNGVYAWSRHPSYFGFFWWGLGTQLVLGNWFCFLAYGLILWKFFAHRIVNEERHLVQFFGRAYVQYREKTPVLIPLIP